MDKEELEKLLYDGDLDLKSLLKLKESMKKFDFSDSDYEYVDDLIIEQIELIDDVNEIKTLKDKYSEYDVSLFDQVIDKKELLKIKELEEMTKEEIQYIYDNELHSFDVVMFFRLLTVIRKYNFSNDDTNYIIELIKDKIEDIDYVDNNDLLNKLNRIKINCFKYKCDTSILDNYIENVKKNTKKGIGIGKLLLWGALGLAGKSHKNSKTPLSWEEYSVMNGGYEPFNFEEEELEDDDYYFEDD